MSHPGAAVLCDVLWVAVRCYIYIHSNGLLNRVQLVVGPGAEIPRLCFSRFVNATTSEMSVPKRKKMDLVFFCPINLSAMYRRCSNADSYGPNPFFSFRTKNMIRVNFMATVWFWHGFDNKSKLVYAGEIQR